MQWVAKKHLVGAAIFLPLMIALTLAVTTGRVSIEPEVPPTLSCFDPTLISIRVSASSQCPPPLIALGNQALVESATAGGIVTALHPILQARFDAAQITAASLGIKLYITSGFRNEDRQAVLFANAIKKYGNETEAAKWVLPPQFSLHPHGLAIDVNYPGNRDGAKWLEENGARFGLCRVYANEWWHFEPVIAPGEKCPAMAANALVDMR